MKPGNIVLISMPQADGQSKRRPALLLKQTPGHNDWLICGISTQLHRHIKGFDELIDEQHPDYKQSNLKGASLVRLGFLTVIPNRDIPGAIGSVSSSTYKRLIRNLVHFLEK